MIIELPFTSDAAQMFTIQLGGRKYQISAQYNDRNGVWTMDMTDPVVNTPIITGIALTLGNDSLLEPYNFNIGHILIIDTSNMGVDAGPDELGGRVKVYWLSTDEILPTDYSPYEFVYILYGISCHQANQSTSHNITIGRTLVGNWTRTIHRSTAGGITKL